MFGYLHCNSWFSFLHGGSSPEVLAETAARLGIKALAITDRNGLYGAVRFQKACLKAGVKPVFGAEIQVQKHRLVLLAVNPKAYERLNIILTKAHLNSRLEPFVTELDSFDLTGLVCLTGFKGSALFEQLQNKGFLEAGNEIKKLKQWFGQDLFFEAVYYAEEGDGAVVKRLVEQAKLFDVSIIAGNDIKYATQEDYKLHDLMICMQELITVFEAHEMRPKNAERFLKTEQQLRKELGGEEQWYRQAAALAERCTINLIPGFVTPPRSNIAVGVDPALHLRLLCEDGLSERYGKHHSDAAVALMEKELEIISALELDDYFLVVHEIILEAERRGIRCSGRGSAANSIVCYLLGITKVDPVRHHLLFERFLHLGRKGTPDIDIDFDTERRNEMLEWIVERFGIDQTAMTATLSTYHLRSAFRDVSKALGFELDAINSLSKMLPHAGCSTVETFRGLIEERFGKNPLVDALIEMVGKLKNCPRHLGLHSGGMVLGRESLYRYTPVQQSANGMNCVQFDKDDVEAMGLIKFDILGLRMLSCISESIELLQRHENLDLDVDRLPLDDPKTFELIRSGDTVGVFQIESQGQMHLLAKNQPETFDDIIAEIALFRPGPLQGGVVYPFVRRRRGEEPVEYLHPVLEPILKDTYGIILFQEQVLEVVHHFAGLSLEEADRFRQLMSKFRDPGDMQNMREKFVNGSIQRGISFEVANEVFDKVSKFVGYGFCRSHAASFAHIVYQSAYLKMHHTAAFMAAFMQVRPGMYNQMTLDQEALKFGVQVLVPDINRSGLRFDLEKNNALTYIRKPLTVIAGMDESMAKKIIMERMNGAYTSIESLQQRTFMDSDVLMNLARSGALDAIAGSGREAVWKAGIVSKRKGFFSIQKDLFSREIPKAVIPKMAELPEKERLSWDYQTHGSARRHPMTFYRRTLNDLEIRTVSQCKRLQKAVPSAPYSRSGIEVTTAGIVILRQRPGTAKGFMFVTLEDETGFIQCVVHPEICDVFSHVLFHGSLIVKGSLGGEGNWVGLYVKEAWIMNQVFGGYEGRPSETGGKDHWVKSPEESSVKEGATIVRPYDSRFRKKVMYL